MTVTVTLTHPLNNIDLRDARASKNRMLKRPNIIKISNMTLTDRIQLSHLTQAIYTRYIRAKSSELAGWA